MSDFVLSRPRTRRLSEILAWLRQARAALAMPAVPADPVPEAFLTDVGIGRQDIQRAVVDGSRRIGLLDLGWQPPRPARRR